MKTREVVSGEKLRGGFYSPEILVDLCLDRVAELVGSQDGLSFIEPAAGDGAFVRGLSRHVLGNRVSRFDAVEVLQEEAVKCSRALVAASFAGTVHSGNVLEWYEARPKRYDVALGNPPYIRYQFISPEDRQRGTAISSGLGVPGPAVSNLWIPVFLLALDSLVDGGVFSMILPTEFLTGVSAGRVRGWLLENTRDLRIDLFQPGSFPAVLQEVLVLTGRKASRGEAENTVQFWDHNGGTRTWVHSISKYAQTWTAFLMSPSYVDAYHTCLALPDVVKLGEVARLSVSTVTGANDFFCVNTETVEKYEMSEWAMPLLPRTRYAKGIEYSHGDHALLISSSVPAWLLSFSADRRSPIGTRAWDYIMLGEQAGLHERYKCRIRQPWYRVPVVLPGELMMSKRSNKFPRVIANTDRVVTTDTIYRGTVDRRLAVTAHDIAAAFHNSLTLLSVEVEGRSFGGGVLELVPSEIAAVRVPVSPVAHRQLPELDAVSRGSSDEYDLIQTTDEHLPSWVPGLTPDLLQVIQEGRRELSARRLTRGGAAFWSGDPTGGGP